MKRKRKPAAKKDEAARISCSHFDFANALEVKLYNARITAIGPVYIQRAEGKVLHTRELLDGLVFANFAADGKLLGVEIL